MDQQLVESAFENERKQEPLVIVFEILCGIAGQLSDIERPSLSDIVTELIAKQLLRDDPNLANLQKQMVFIFIGWLTLLYDPAPKPTADALEIQLGEGPDGFPILTDIFTELSVEIYELADVPFHQVLKHFGRLIEDSWLSQSRIQSNTPQDIFSERLIVSYLNFHILSKVANIHLEFVKSISLHLEFDEETRTLKLFRLPSLCRLICSGPFQQSNMRSNKDGRKNYLARLVSSNDLG